MGWLIRFLLLSIVLTLILRAVRQFFASVAQGMQQGPRPPRVVQEGVRMVRDPICGTYILPTNALATRDEHGLHYFCSDKCRAAFLGNAQRPAGR
jgi:YHS domain-containing protein